MKKLLFLTFIAISVCVFSQVGINTENPQAIFHVDGAQDNPSTGIPATIEQVNDFVVTQDGNVGVGIVNPVDKLEITSGVPGISGLKFNNINSSTPPNYNTASLGIDANGNVVVQSPKPILTAFKAFVIDDDVAANSLISIGTLEFRYNGSCVLGDTYYIQTRSTSGVNNVGIIHGIYRTSQTGSTFVNTAPLHVTPTFSNITASAMNCTDNGHTQFSFFSYTDRTFYRVNVHIADGDGLGLGANGYIFVEFQR